MKLSLVDEILVSRVGRRTRKKKKEEDGEENTNETFRGIFRESVMEIAEGVKNEEEIRRKVGGTPTELSIRDR